MSVKKNIRTNYARNILFFGNVYGRKQIMYIFEFSKYNILQMFLNL